MSIGEADVRMASHLEEPPQVTVPTLDARPEARARDRDHPGHGPRRSAWSAWISPVTASLRAVKSPSACLTSKVTTLVAGRAPAAVVRWRRRPGARRRRWLDQRDGVGPASDSHGGTARPSRVGWQQRRGVPRAQLPRTSSGSHRGSTSQRPARPVGSDRSGRNELTPGRAGSYRLTARNQDERPMAAAPSASYSLTVRLEIQNKPGHAGPRDVRHRRGGRRHRRHRPRARDRATWSATSPSRPATATTARRSSTRIRR